MSVALFGACGTGVAETTETPDSNANVDAEAPETTEAESTDEEVPDFDDAEKALKSGIAYLDENKIAKAIEALEQAVEIDEDLADAHFQLGVALSLKESEEEQRVSDEIDPDEDSSSSAKSAKEEEKESDAAFKNAIKAYKKLIAKDRKDHRAQYNLGRSYMKLYEDKDARKALERAVKLNGEDVEYRTELGSVLIRLAQYPAAIKQLEKALELDDLNYRAEDMLAKAKAGRKRVNHVQKPKTRKSSGSSNSSAKKNTSSNSNSITSRPRKVDAPPPPKPKKPESKKPKA
ncbi:MAG: tetratricopeptide repeat protein [Pyrinomonadaceae bacterium]|nr:tetratricopeptide repeat protein [Pyrinomonadaceae bacterium]